MIFLDWQTEKKSSVGPIRRMETKFWLWRPPAKPNIPVWVGQTALRSQVWSLTQLSYVRSWKSKIIISILGKCFRLALCYSNSFSWPTLGPNGSTHSLWTPSWNNPLPPSWMQLRRNGWIKRKTWFEVQTCSWSKDEARRSHQTAQAWSWSS